MTEKDREYIKTALSEAQLAADCGEVPVGAVIVRDGEIIARGRNNREGGKTALGHAEINAISEACKSLRGWHLERCTLYVTLEPCAMCAGAILNAHIDRVVFGAYDKNLGAFGSVINLTDGYPARKCEVEGGVMEEECSSLITSFFKKLREKKSNE